MRPVRAIFLFALTGRITFFIIYKPKALPLGYDRLPLRGVKKGYQIFLFKILIR